MMLAKVTQSAILLALPLFGAPASQSPARPTTPPARIVFKAEAPGPMQVGKLWSDFGLFYPWTGLIGRSEWEKAYFGLLNQAAKTPSQSQAILAEAIGLLQDPASMLLPKGQGEGAFFLPVIWAVKGDAIWVIGGDSSQFKTPVGPVVSINGQPIQAFLAARIGTHRTPEMTLAVLYLSGVSNEKATWDLGTDAKTTIKLSSVNDMPAETWVEGGWQGTPLHALSGLTAKLDLQTAPWFSAKFNGREKILDGLAALSKNSQRLPVANVHRKHYGYSESRPTIDTFYTTKMVSEGKLIAEPDSSPIRVELVNWSEAAALSVSNNLAGWGIDPQWNAAASAVTYSINAGWNIHLRTASWCAPCQMPGQKAEPSFYRAGNATLFPSGSLLTHKAAVYLSAAHLANEDHLFAFTPQEFQKPYFEALASLAGSAETTAELVLKAARFSRDPHWFIASYRNGNKDLLGPTSHGDQASFNVTVSPNLEELLVSSVYRSKDGDHPMVDLAPGTIIKSIGGVSVKAWLTTQAVQFETRPGEWGRSANTALIFESSKTESPITLSIVDRPGAKPRDIQAIIGNLAAGKAAQIKPGAPKYHVPLPATWEYKSMYDPIPWAKVSEGAKQGKNFILDMRYNPAYTPPRDIQETQGFDAIYSVATPTEPVAWGGRSNNNEYLTGINKPIQELTVARCPGIVVALTDCFTQSFVETRLEVLRILCQVNGIRIFLVGHSTAGITGPMTSISLPVGESNQVVAVSPTNSFPVWTYGTFNYIGVPMDRIITFEEEVQTSHKGKEHQDLLLETLVRLLPEITHREPVARSLYKMIHWQ